MNEVLQIDKIYTNAIKGDLAKKEELESMFPTMSYEDIVKLILDKGEIQVSEKERSLNFQNLKNDIANIVVEKTYNTENGLPFPQHIILQVLDDINFNVREGENAKKQALLAIKQIQEKGILPLERKLMQIFLTVKSSKLCTEDKDFQELKTKIVDFLKTINAHIVESNLDNPKQFKIKCNILPNHYREILTNFDDGKY